MLLYKEIYVKEQNYGHRTFSFPELSTTKSVFPRYVSSIYAHIQAVRRSLIGFTMSANSGRKRRYHDVYFYCLSWRTDDGGSFWDMVARIDIFLGLSSGFRSSSGGSFIWSFFCVQLGCAQLRWYHLGKQDMWSTSGLITRTQWPKHCEIGTA